jgi:hypothetical protein
VILVGFPYAYFNKVNVFNQTKSELESMGFQVIDTPSNWHFSTKNTFITVAANLTSFVSVAKQYQEWGSTTIYQQGYSFYLLAPFYFTTGEAVEYTPCNSIWWIWSF